MKKNLNKKIKVIITGIDPANKNTAAYNRFCSIVKMVRAVFACEVIMAPRPCKNRGIFNKLVARFSFVCLIKGLIHKIDNEDHNHIIFLRYTDPLLCLICWLLAKPKNIKLALERNEYPAVLTDENNNTIKKILYKYLILTWHYRLFDVLFLMTDELIDFYGRHTKRNCIIHKLPMTVDFSRFERIKPIRNTPPYIFYAGSLSESKDGVESLINAFKIISNTYSGICLKIAGATKEGKQEKKLKEMIKKYQLQDRVELMGFIDREDIPRYLCSATIVVLPRPDSMQARGGFPTKLGEYLAAGNPVVVTRVGEIPNYLSEKEIFFICPDHIQSELVKKVEYILCNIEEAMQVAIEGKKTAKLHFSLPANEKLIREAFTSLFKSR